MSPTTRSLIKAPELFKRSVDLLAAIGVGTLYITSVQYSELLITPDENRRETLTKVLEQLAPTKIPVLSPVWIDDMHWDDNAPWREHPSDVESTIYGNSENRGRWKDATIGAAAWDNGCIIVTSDAKFRNRAGRANIESLTPDQLFISFARK